MFNMNENEVPYATLKEAAKNDTVLANLLPGNESANRSAAEEWYTATFNANSGIGEGTVTQISNATERKGVPGFRVDALREQGKTLLDRVAQVATSRTEDGLPVTDLDRTEYTVKELTRNLNGLVRTANTDRGTAIKAALLIDNARADGNTTTYDLVSQPARTAESRQNLLLGSMSGLINDYQTDVTRLEGIQQRLENEIDRRDNGVKYLGVDAHQGEISFERAAHELNFAATLLSDTRIESDSPNGEEFMKDQRLVDASYVGRQRWVNIASVAIDPDAIENDYDNAISIGEVCEQPKMTSEAARILAEKLNLVADQSDEAAGLLAVLSEPEGMDEYRAAKDDVVARIIAHNAQQTGDTTDQIINLPNMLKRLGYDQIPDAQVADFENAREGMNLVAKNEYLTQCYEVSFDAMANTAYELATVVSNQLKKGVDFSPDQMRAASIAAKYRDLSADQIAKPTHNESLTFVYVADEKMAETTTRADYNSMPNAEAIRDGGLHKTVMQVDRDYHAEMTAFMEKGAV